MAIFAVIAQPGDSLSLLPGELEREFPDDYLEVAKGVWLVAASGVTAKELSARIGIAEGRIRSAIVLETASYWGRASLDIWNWIKKKWEATENA